jgi:hypothetical protein
MCGASWLLGGPIVTIAELRELLPTPAEVTGQPSRGADREPGDTESHPPLGRHPAAGPWRSVSHRPFLTGTYVLLVCQPYTDTECA